MDLNASMSKLLSISVLPVPHMAAALLVAEACSLHVPHLSDTPLAYLSLEDIVAQNHILPNCYILIIQDNKRNETQ